MVNVIKHFTIIIYDSRVVWLENCPYYDSRVVIYARKMFIRLAIGHNPKQENWAVFNFSDWILNQSESLKPGETQIYVKKI